VKVLVTGGAGFVGKHLCTALLHMGHDVYCVDNFYTSSREDVEPLLSRLAVFEADVEDLSRVSSAIATDRVKIDQVYHLACPASPVHYQRDPVKTMRTAFIGTMNVFELALQHGARVLIASTSEVYGDPLVHPQREDYTGNVNTLGPRSCYDEGKRAAEALAYSYVTSRGLDVRIARIFNTYGPGMGTEDGRLIPNFVARAIRGESLEVHGDGQQTRSLCYVDDMVVGLQRLMASDLTRAPVEAVNLGNSDERSVLDIAVGIANMFDPKPGIVHMPALADDPKQRNPDTSRAKALFDWSPRTDYDHGIRLTVDWFKKVAKDRK
jgi:UDP-glucuronate decarboxylase